MRAFTLVVSLAVAASSALAAQTPRRTGEQIDSAVNVHKGDFDYLLGDWEFTAVSKQFGTFRGVWGVVKLAEGQILDEYRVVGDSGETLYVTTTFRNYNGGADRWELIGTHPGDGLQDFGTGHMVGNEMRIEQTFGVVRGQPNILRIRYYNIRPDAFSWAADRSTDGGRTWVAGYQTIEARRVGPARTQAPIAQPRRRP